MLYLRTEKGRVVEMTSGNKAETDLGKRNQ